MKATLAIAIAAFGVATACSARADPSTTTSPASPPPLGQKRPAPDYGRPRRREDTGRQIVPWIPRVVLSPIYLATEYGIRAPLSVVVPAAEEAELPRKARDFFLFLPDHKGGILPVGYLDFGLNPSVGVYGFWKDAFAAGNDWHAHAEVWPTDWYAVSVDESARLDRDKTIQFRFSGSHRPDRVFYGIGPDTLQSSQSRYTDAVVDEGVSLRWKYWRASRIELAVGLRSDDPGPGHYGHDPSLQQEAATGAFAIPFGYGERYTAEYNRIVASLDSRRPAPAAGSGVRVEGNAEQVSNLLGTPASGWIRYGATAGGFLDLDGYGHVLGLSVVASFADPLGTAPVPFTELVGLGGEEPMLGYLPRRLVDRSAAVAALRYTWPLAPFFGGTLEAALGNVFDEHLSGLRTGRLRFSGDLGIATVGLSDYQIEAVVAMGSETFERGGQIDSFRVKLSLNHGF